MKKYILFLYLFATCVLAQAAFYEIKEGDVMSRIARKFLGKPIYGPKGTLNQLKNLNPSLQNLDKLKIGQLLKVSEEKSVERKIAQDGAKAISTLRQTTEVLYDSPFKISPFVKYEMHNWMATDRDTKGKANIASQFYLDAGIKFKQEWDSNLETFQKIELQYIQLAKISKGTKKLAEDAVWGSGLEFGIQKTQFRERSFGASLGYEYEFIVQGVDAQTIALEPIALGRVGVNYSENLLKSKSLNFDLVSNLKYISSGENLNTSVHGGATALLGAKITEYSLDQESRFLLFGFRGQHLRTSAVLQNEFGMFLEFGFSLGTREGKTNE